MTHETINTLINSGWVGVLYIAGGVLVILICLMPLDLVDMIRGKHFKISGFKEYFKALGVSILGQCLIFSLALNLYLYFLQRGLGFYEYAETFLLTIFLTLGWVWVIVQLWDPKMKDPNDDEADPDYAAYFNAQSLRYRIRFWAGLLIFSFVMGESYLLKELESSVIEEIASKQEVLAGKELVGSYDVYELIDSQNPDEKPFIVVDLLPPNGVKQQVVLLPKSENVEIAMARVELASSDRGDGRASRHWLRLFAVTGETRMYRERELPVVELKGSFPKGFRL